MLSSSYKLWYLQESNQGHQDFQSCALPTELRYLPRLYLIFSFAASFQKGVQIYSLFLQSQIDCRVYH